MTHLQNGFGLLPPNIATIPLGRAAITLGIGHISS